jgi:hypothetical protein
MENHVYYSQGTKLAARINRDYYNNIHYVWCCDKPFYTVAERQPVSSNPLARCEYLIAEIETNDGHTHYIDDNRNGIKIGIEEKAKAGVITTEQRAELIRVVNDAPNEFFYPVIYVIPYEKVSELVKPVNTSKKASSVSKEFLIEELPRSCFDIIDFSNIIPSVLRGIGQQL